MQNRKRALAWINDEPVYWRICASTLSMDHSIDFNPPENYDSIPTSKWNRGYCKRSWKKGYGFAQCVGCHLISCMIYSTRSCNYLSQSNRAFHLIPLIGNENYRSVYLMESWVLEKILNKEIRICTTRWFTISIHVWYTHMEFVSNHAFHLIPLIEKKNKEVFI